MRCFLLRMALCQAYKAMMLDTFMPGKYHYHPPKCYHSDEYDETVARTKSSQFIIVGNGQYTFWENIGDRGTYWFSWSTSTLEEFVRKYHRSSIFGEAAFYTTMVVIALYGFSYHLECFTQGRKEEYREKEQMVRYMLVDSLEQYFKSFSYRTIYFFLKIAK